MEIIVESPKGCREKYKYNKELHLFALHKLLPANMVFPFSFGFIPGTKGEDGDPLDAFIISEFDGFPGCIMQCRVIGCITMEESNEGRMIRNDRFLVIPELSAQFSDIVSIEDIRSSIISSLENFLVTYLLLEEKKINLLGNMNALSAKILIEENKRSIASDRNK